ncbi:MAG: glycosyl hydrolase family 38, partial [Bacteroidales bacterium]|nr:glycosyl hydrolase family 38 [Bacteroidales bacterium]
TSAANRDGTYEFEIRLFKTAKRIDLAYYIEKKMVLEPEGIYIAFPFVLNEGVIAFDVQGGEIRAGIDQIPGSANDWNTVQNYARVSNGKNQIVISSPETPLMQFGGINTGRYKAGATPESTHIFGWPMNNYWVTNFNAEQHGGFSWVYSVTSGAGSEMKDAALFGRGNRTPILARVLPGDGTGDTNWQGSYIKGWPDNILLISAIPEQDGRSAIIQLRETEGREAVISLMNGVNGVRLKCIQVDVTGTQIENGDNNMKPFETRFFRIEF